MLLFVWYTACVLLDSYLTTVLYVQGRWVLGTIFLIVGIQSVQKLREVLR